MDLRLLWDYTLGLATRMPEIPDRDDVNRRSESLQRGYGQLRIVNDPPVVERTASITT
jgi:hypothetical protein